MSIDRIYVQRQYAERVCMFMSQCVIKSHAPFQANFRCHICGDSSKSKNKKRGYILENTKGLKVLCHNCGYNELFDTYLKEYHPELHSQYVFDMIKEYHGRQPTRNNSANTKPVSQPKISTSDYLFGLERLSDVSRSHPAREYLARRQLPESALSDIYYTTRFYGYVNEHLPDKFGEYLVNNHEHGRIILPLAHQNKSVFGVIGRSLDPQADVRYLTIKFDPDANKIYGLDRLDLRKHAYALEGPIDSLFLPNSIALAGTDGSFEGVFSRKDQYTIILDNQPRQRDVISKYSKYISNGSNIVIWPDHIKSKDINDMILSGYTAEELMSVVSKHTYQGLMATIRFNAWKKI